MAEIINYSDAQLKLGQKAFDAGKARAGKIVEDPDKLSRLLKRLEYKLKLIPKVGDTLSGIPVLVSMFRSYVRHEYTDLPLGTIIAVVAAIGYFVSPIDLIPDAIPGIGLTDDALIITICLKQIDSDVQEYRKWLAMNHREI